MMARRRDPLDRARHAYLEQRVQGADPRELLQMLYEGALGSVKAGQKQLEAEDWEKAHDNLSRARRIVTYLLGSLRKEGGEISVRLQQLYTFCFEHISRANLEKQPDYLDGVIQVLTELSGAWSDLSKQALTVAAGNFEEEDRG